MRRGGGRTAMLVSILWIAAVSFYMLWAVIQEAGLYRWLIEFQLAQWGSYAPKWSAILPALLLCAPALWYLRARAEAEQANAPPGPVEIAGRMRRNAGWMALAGLAAGLIGAGAYGWSLKLPDGSEPPVPLDLARLATERAPAGRVRVTGNVDPDASSSLVESDRYGEDTTFYAAFRADAAAKDAPVVLFIARATGGGPVTAQGFLAEQDGFLIENGLPSMVRDDLVARGVRLAEPHYVLRTGRDTRREPFYITAALGGFLCLALLTVAGIGALQARGRSRSV